MTNDLKLWLVRIVAALCVVVNLKLLGNMMTSALGDDGHVTRWAVLFFLSMIVSVGLGVYYTLAKDRRWDSANKDIEQIETETIANTVQQETQHNDTKRNPTNLN